jgi:hypothetical protein
MQKYKVSVVCIILVSIVFLAGCTAQSLDNLYEESSQAEIQSEGDVIVHNNPSTSTYISNGDIIDFSHAIQLEPAPASIYEIPVNDNSKVATNKIGTLYWNDKIAMDQGTLKINALIDSPATDHHPIFLIKDHNFTKEDLDRAAVVLFPNIQGVLQNDISRAEIINELAEIRLGRFAGIDSATGDPIYQTYSGQDQEIAQLEDLLGSMPNDTVLPVEKVDFSEAHSNKFLLSGNSLLYLDTNVNEIQVRKDRATEVITESRISKAAEPNLIWGSLIDDISITPPPSIESTINLLIGVLGPSGLVQVQSERALLIDAESNAAKTIGYYFVFARSIGDNNLVHIKAYNSNSQYYEQNNGSTMPPACNYETVGVFLDHSGIRYIEWKNAFDPIKIINPNVRLLAFSDVQRVICDTAISLVNQSSGPLWGKDIVINRIALTNCIQPAQDISECAYLAPAWLVFATASSKTDSATYDFIFAVSAIDGSPIPLDW